MGCLQFVGANLRDLIDPSLQDCLDDCSFCPRLYGVLFPIFLESALLHFLLGLYAMGIALLSFFLGAKARFCNTCIRRPCI